jgi:hypothetical protein
MFFTRSGATWGAILESHQVGNHWSEPEIAPFSGEWSDLQPVLSHDGSYLIFSSWRPVGLNSTPSPDKGTPVRAAYLWRVDRAGSGWGQPVRLPDTVNFTPRMFKPTLAADGSIYFMAMEKGKKFRLFRSQYQNGNYHRNTRMATTKELNLCLLAMAPQAMSIPRSLLTNPSCSLVATAAPLATTAMSTFLSFSRRLTGGAP